MSELLTSPEFIRKLEMLSLLTRKVLGGDLKADRKSGRLEVLSLRLEDDEDPRHREAARTALDRFAEALSLRLG